MVLQGFQSKHSLSKQQMPSDVKEEDEEDEEDEDNHEDEDEDEDEDGDNPGFSPPT